MSVLKAYSGIIGLQTHSTRHKFISQILDSTWAIRTMVKNKPPTVLLVISFNLTSLGHHNYLTLFFRHMKCVVCTREVSPFRLLTWQMWHKFPMWIIWFNAKVKTGTTQMMFSKFIKHNLDSAELGYNGLSQLRMDSQELQSTNHESTRYGQSEYSGNINKDCINFSNAKVILWGFSLQQ